MGTTMAGLLRFAALCLLLSVCAEVVTAQATCQQNDELSLLYLVQDIVFARNEFVTWVQGTNCCTWKGVTCDESGYVIALDIENVDQNPPYPAGPGGYWVGSGIATLERLVSLVIKNVAFNAGVPPAWGTITTLQVLNVTSCNVAGTLPAEFCLLSNMVNFTMADNLLSNPVPACMQTPYTTFSHLEYFNISGNNNLNG